MNGTEAGGGCGGGGGGVVNGTNASDAGGQDCGEEDEVGRAMLV